MNQTAMASEYFGPQSVQSCFGMWFLVLYFRYQFEAHPDLQNCQMDRNLRDG
jgi:hypothetical protein